MVTSKEIGIELLKYGYSLAFVWFFEVFSLSPQLLSINIRNMILSIGVDSPA